MRTAWMGENTAICGNFDCSSIAILSASMLLRYSFDLQEEADAIENAVKQVLAEGYRTGDIMSEGCTKVGCAEMGTLIAERVKKGA